MRRLRCHKACRRDLTAAFHACVLLVFPEESGTGFEPDLAFASKVV